MLALALRLGKTLAQLRRELSAEELFLWRAFDAESPISDVRGDVQTAIVAAAAFQAQGAKVKPAELLPQWTTPPPPDPEDEAEAVAASWRAHLERLAKNEPA